MEKGKGTECGLEAFMQHYFIDDGRTENVKLPDRPLKKQKGLDEYT